MRNIPPGVALRAARIDHGLTQEEVAELLGVKQPAVSLWEAGAKDPDPSRWPEIHDLFGVEWRREPVEVAAS